MNRGKVRRKKEGKERKDGGGEREEEGERERHPRGQVRLALKQVAGVYKSWEGSKEQ